MLRLLSRSRVEVAAGSAQLRSLSHMWKQRRDADQFADMAIAQGLRSRAAFKLKEIDERFGRFLRQGAIVVDLGAAPGGFSSIAARKIYLEKEMDNWSLPSRLARRPAVPETERSLEGSQVKRTFGKLICVDIQDMEPIRGAHFVHGDFVEECTQQQILHALDGQEADVVLSDMSPSTTGDPGLDHSRIVALAEDASSLARRVLRNGGVFVCKLFSGSDERNFRESLRECFVRVKAVKPAASRKHSPEIFYVATGFVPMHLQRPTFDAGPRSNVDELMDDLEHLRGRRRRAA